MHTFSGDNQKKGARELLQPCSPNIKTTQISINKEMDEDYVLYTCNGISSSFENVENSVTCYNMEIPGRLHSKWNKSVVERQVLNESTSVGCLK